MALFDALRSTELFWRGSYQEESTVIPMTPCWYFCITPNQDIALEIHSPHFKHTLKFMSSGSWMTWTSPCMKLHYLQVRGSANISGVTIRVPGIRFDKSSQLLHAHLDYCVRLCKALSMNFLQCNFHKLENTGRGGKVLRNIPVVQIHGSH